MEADYLCISRLNEAISSPDLRSFSSSCFLALQNAKRTKYFSTFYAVRALNDRDSSTQSGVHSTILFEKRVRANHGCF